MSSIKYVTALMVRRLYEPWESRMNIAEPRAVATIPGEKVRVVILLSQQEVPTEAGNEMSPEMEAEWKELILSAPCVGNGYQCFPCTD